MSYLINDGKLIAYTDIVFQDNEQVRYSYCEKIRRNEGYAKRFLMPQIGHISNSKKWEKKAEKLMYGLYFARLVNETRRGKCFAIRDSFAKFMGPDYD